MGMMTTAATFNMVKALTRQLGEKTAIELVEYIESARVENLATKSDIQELRAEAKSNIQELAALTKSDIQELRAEAKSNIQELAALTKSGIQGLRAETRAGIQELRSDMRTGFLTLENRLLWKMLGGMSVMLGILAALLRYLLR